MRRMLGVLLLAVLVGVAAVVGYLLQDDREAVAAAEPAPYNTGEPVTPPLCLEDHTGGFPVKQAAAEFTGIVEVVVAEDCAGYVSSAEVVTVIRNGESWSGWYNRPSPERGGAALISLNVAESYRIDPHGWRMILIHEIGHALGLGHTYEVPSIMHPSHTTTYDGLTAEDRRQLAELY